MADVPSRDATGGLDPLAEVRREFSAGLGARVRHMRSALDALAEGFDPTVAETFHRVAHSLEGTAASFGANEVAAYASSLAKFGRRWLQTRAVMPEELSTVSDELERIGVAVEQYRARIERSDAE